MKEWYCKVRLSDGNSRVITVYAESRKDAYKVLQQQWGVALGGYSGYTVESIFSEA